MKRTCDRGKRFKRSNISDNYAVNQNSCLASEHKVALYRERHPILQAFLHLFMNNQKSTRWLSLPHGCCSGAPLLFVCLCLCL